jgi:N-methylhydantoinase A
VLARIVARAGMAAGSVVAGPAIIEQSDTTTLVEPGWQAVVASNGILIIKRTA